jgi:hypothetical protein
VIVLALLSVVGIAVSFAASAVYRRRSVEDLARAELAEAELWRTVLELRTRGFQVPDPLVPRPEGLELPDADHVGPILPAPGWSR